MYVELEARQCLSGMCLEPMEVCHPRCQKTPVRSLGRIPSDILRPSRSSWGRPLSMQEMLRLEAKRCASTPPQFIIIISSESIKLQHNPDDKRYDRTAMRVVRGARPRASA